MTFKKIQILKNECIPIEKWIDLMQNNPFASAFQTPAFYAFINSVPGFTAEVIAISDYENILALAVITLQKEPGIKRYFSRRAIIYGGPLISFEYPDLAGELLKQISKSHAGDQIFIEIRNLGNYSKFKSIFALNEWNYIKYSNLFIDLSNKSRDELISKMSYNRRREIQLSFKEGAIVKECETENELRDLYLILYDLYTNRVKLPLPSFNYFKIFWQKKVGPVFIVQHNNIIIGGSVCPVLKGESIYTLYYCGLRDYHKRIFPTHLAVLGAIDYAIKNGIKKLDFMGAGKPENDYGVRKYKKEFGGNLVEYGRYVKINKPILYKVGKFGVLLLKKL